MKTYRARPDITQEQVEMLLDALNPFYGFGCVLDTANEANGTAHIALHDGNDDEARYSSLSLNGIAPEGEILSVCGAWDRVSASYCGPTLTVGDFFAARDAFLACIEQTQRPELQKDEQ